MARAKRGGIYVCDLNKTEVPNPDVSILLIINQDVCLHIRVINGDSWITVQITAVLGVNIGLTYRTKVTMDYVLLV